MRAELFDNSSLPDELDAAMREELREGERLLWVGQPRPGRFARQAIPIVLFGIPWTAFALFWMAAASGMLFAGAANAGPGPGGGFFAIFACFPLFGLPFVLIGFAMLGSPFWLWRQAKRTCYALTDRRAILREAGKFGSIEVRSYESEALGQITRTQYADGCGDLIFEEFLNLGRDSDGDRTRRTVRRGFMAIDNVRGVEELLRKALVRDDDSKKQE